MNRFQAHRWDESRWENEIRRDERRINAYFSGLLDRLDLPGEETLIAKSIAKKQDLFPEDAEDASLHCWSYFMPDTQDEEEETETEPESDLSHPEQMLIDLLDELTCQWNEIYIKTFPQDTVPLGLFVSCWYSKLLARLTDFVDSGVDQDSSPELTRTLGKLVIIDIASTAEALTSIIQIRPDIQVLIKKHLNNLRYIHDRVVTLIESTRRQDG